jgi:hypothetical protein
VDAELRCDVRCDTRIAITATRGAKTELWDLRNDGVSWSARLRTDRTTLLAYLGPQPGATDPRLVGLLSPTALAIGDAGDVMVPLSASRDYHDASSLDFDRDERDTAVLSATEVGNAANQFIEVLKLGDGSVREIPTVASTRVSWGDIDHDPYPDGVGSTGARYTWLTNVDGDDHLRSIDDSVSSGFAGGPTVGTPTPPATRSFDWADLDGDHVLDLVGFGNSLRVHLGSDRLDDVPIVNIDCDPPKYPTGTCDTTQASFAGVVLPGDAVIASTAPTQAIYRVKVMKGPQIAVSFTSIGLTGPDVCPAASCTPILAVVARDLDGDHGLDVVAIDAQLHLFVGYSRDGLTTLAETTPITTATTFTAVRTSVSAAPR